MNGTSMTVDIDAVASKSLPSSGGVTTVEAMLDPVAITKPTTRHVGLLVDTSGSMAGQKIENAKNGATQALRVLDEDDYVSIVGFDSAVETILPMSRWGDVDQRSAENDVTRIDSGGGTDIYKGLETVRDQLIEDAPSDPAATKRIVLLSDGQDRYDPSTYRNLAAEFDEDGISIMAAGIGSAYDESVMLALANASGGTPADLSEDDIDQFLEETVSETEDVVASNPELSIEPARGFIVNDEPAYFDAPKTERRAVDTDESTATVALPELQIGQPHRFTFEMLGQPKPTGLTHDLATLRVHDSTGTVLGETDVTVEYVEEGKIERVEVEKARAAAKVTTDILNPDVSEDEVTAGIEALEERGWTDTANDLKRKRNQADSSGGLIRLSRSDESGDSR